MDNSNDNGLAWHKKQFRKLMDAYDSDPSRMIVIDTETTGLKPGRDEVLQVSIADMDGNELFNHLIRPTHRKSWPDATKIHGIRWKDVKDEKTLMEYEDELAPYFNGDYLIVGYNVGFDKAMLEGNGAIVKGDTCDLMKIYSFIKGPWSEWRQRRNWVKLTECAKNYGYTFAAHDAMEDAKATAYVAKKMLQDDDLRCQYVPMEYIRETASEVGKSLKKTAGASEPQRQSAHLELDADTASPTTRKKKDNGRVSLLLLLFCFPLYFQKVTERFKDGNVAIKFIRILLLAVAWFFYVILVSGIIMAIQGGGK